MSQAGPSKIFLDPREAFEGVGPGQTWIFGGFGPTGVPENSIDFLKSAGYAGITAIACDVGVNHFGLWHLFEKKQIQKMISAYVGDNDLFREQYLQKQLEVELVPMGTLAEKLRCGGAGIPAFFTPTGAGTDAAAGKEVRTFEGRDCLLETSLTGDFGFIKAWKADPFGNLVFRKTTRNFNPLVASASRVTIAEVEEWVPLGALDPDQIHVPGIFINRVFVGTYPNKKIAHRTIRPHTPTPRDPGGRGTSSC